jgi:uncharacterized protein (DUF302 family)
MKLEVSYGITRRLLGITLEAARARVVTALASEGFGVLTEIDFQATLKKKLDVDIAPYIILGACNPKLAHAAYQQEPAVGLLLPCNVVLAEDGADVLVSALSPKAMFALAGSAAEMAAIAADAEQRLRSAVAKI